MTHTPSSAWPFPTGNVAPTVVQNLRDRVKGAKTSARWSQTSLEDFAQLIVDGKSITEIAQALNRTPKAITNQLGDMKIRKTKTGARLADLVTATVNRAVKKTLPTNHRARWTDKDDKAVLLAFLSGSTAEQIGLTTGRTAGAIASRLHTLGLLSFDKLVGDAGAFLTKPKVWFTVQA